MSLSGLRSPTVQLSKHPQGGLKRPFNLLYRVVTFHPTTPLAVKMGPTHQTRPPKRVVRGLVWRTEALVPTAARARNALSQKPHRHQQPRLRR